MKSRVSLLSESSATGTLPPKECQPKSSGKVFYCEFSVPDATPLHGGIPITEFMQQLESDPQISQRFAQGRRMLAGALGSLTAPTFRDLRLKAGLSQIQLAKRANATQSYIARLEAGTLDPGTDMLARLAKALDMSEAEVFAAVRILRGSSHGR